MPTLPQLQAWTINALQSVAHEEATPQTSKPNTWYLRRTLRWTPFVSSPTSNSNLFMGMRALKVDTRGHCHVEHASESPGYMREGVSTCNPGIKQSQAFFNKGMQLGAVDRWEVSKVVYVR